MSIKYSLWKKRTEFRLRKDDCFHIDNPGSANPHELRYGITNAFRDAATAAIGKTDVLKGDWDRLERRLASDGDTGSNDVQGGSPVTLAIGRDGDPIVVTGEQQLIGLNTATDEIPVQIAFVHPQWQRFRNQVLNFAGAHRNVVYQKIHHPDLIRVPYGHGDERLELITPHMPITSGTVLDIGANWGYWTHVMTRLGLRCTAVDHNSKNALFIKRLRRAMNRSFEFIESSIFDLPGPLTYDLILGLNIFHHFIRDPAMLEKFCGLLGRLDAKYMFFEPHCFEELDKPEIYKNMAEEEFIAFILERSCFTDSEEIGLARNGRRVFLLRR